MSAPVSQISAAELPAGTEQLVLVPVLGQRTHDGGASRLRVPPVLLEHQGKMLANELGTRNAALASCPREKSIIVWIERDRGCFRQNRRCTPCIHSIELSSVARAKLDDAHVGECMLHERVVLHDALDLIAALRESQDDAAVAGNRGVGSSPPHPH